VTTGDLIRQRRLYPVQEAADLLGVHRTTLYNRAGEGLITLLRIGGRTYVAADEIERYIAAAQPVDAAGRQVG
jgi:excisionase family DNA binding protein